MSNPIHVMGTADTQYIDFEVFGGEVSLAAKGLAGAEAITINRMFQGVPDPIVQEGEAQALDVDDTNKLIQAPGQYRLTKTTTSAAITVVLSGQVEVTATN